MIWRSILAISLMYIENNSIFWCLKVGRAMLGDVDQLAVKIYLVSTIWWRKCQPFGCRPFWCRPIHCQPFGVLTKWLVFTKNVVRNLIIFQTGEKWDVINFMIHNSRELQLLQLPSARKSKSINLCFELVVQLEPQPKKKIAYNRYKTLPLPPQGESHIHPLAGWQFILISMMSVNFYRPYVIDIYCYTNSIMYNMWFE